VHVVDGTHPNPEEQVRAVREVLAEVGAERLPELLVVNKIDVADEETLLRLKRSWPDAVFVSARANQGLDSLRAAIERRLPRPAVELRAVIPYDRGDLVARAHREGEVLGTRHTDEGTFLHARVGGALAAELSAYTR
jgi:GTP-binding protein HflX